MSRSKKKSRIPTHTHSHTSGYYPKSSQKKPQKSSGNGRKTWLVPIQITPLALKKVKYFCSECSHKEWGGTLLYKSKGSVKDESLSVTVVDVYPQVAADEFRAMYLETDFDHGVFDYILTNYPDEVAEIKQGLIHSHCDAGVFFSATDTDELKENASNFVFYLSLITNNRNKWCGKIAISKKVTGTTKGTTQMRQDDGTFLEEPFEMPFSKEEIITHDCAISLPPRESIDHETASLFKKVMARSRKVAPQAQSSMQFFPSNAQMFDEAYQQSFEEASIEEPLEGMVEDLLVAFINPDCTALWAAVSTMKHPEDYSPHNFLSSVQTFFSREIRRREQKEVIIEAIKHLQHYKHKPIVKQVINTYEKFAQTF